MHPLETILQNKNKTWLEWHLGGAQSKLCPVAVVIKIETS